jgi:hypothetical protein
MPRIADRNKIYFDNPIKNLSDLFFYIARILKSEYTQIEQDCSLCAGRLSVESRRNKEGENISEIIDIKQIWDDSSEEIISYSSDYIDQKVWEEQKKNFFSSSSTGDEIFQSHLNSNLEIKFLDKISFFENSQYIQLPQCTLEYETNNLGRALQTLASLRLGRRNFLDLEDEDECEDENAFFLIYSKMLKLVESDLRTRFGEDEMRWRKYLRAGKCSTKIPFKAKDDKTDPPWIIGYYLVDLCKLYIK